MAMRGISGLWNSGAVMILVTDSTWSMAVNSAFISGAVADSSAVPLGGYGELAIAHFYVNDSGNGGSFVLSILEGDIVGYEACPGK